MSNDMATRAKISAVELAATLKTLESFDEKGVGGRTQYAVTTAYQGIEVSCKKSIVQLNKLVDQMNKEKMIPTTVITLEE